jgi:hypothetical protein
VTAFAFPALRLAFGVAIAVGAHQAGELFAEACARFAQAHAVLRALGAGDARLDGGEVERDGLGVGGFGGVGCMEQRLFLVVGFDECDLLFAAAGEAEVAKGFCVDGEDAAGCTVLGGHVGDGGAVGERQFADACSVELDKLADDAEFAQHFCHGEDKVGRGRAFLEFARQLEANDLRDQHGYWLAEHGGFSFNAADAPAEDAEAVDHGGVGVGADKGVGIGAKGAIDLGGEDAAREVFEVDLVADAHAGRNGGEVAKGRLAPLEESVTFAVTIKLQHGVDEVGVAGAEFVDLDGVVDDQLGGLQRVDFLRVAAEDLHGIAHGGEVHDGGDAGKVLHEDTRGHEGDFAVGGGGGVPGGEEFYVARGDALAVFLTE